MPSFADYFNRASEQRDRLIDIEAKRVAAGIPAAGANQTPPTGPAVPPPSTGPATNSYGVTPSATDQAIIDAQDRLRTDNAMRDIKSAGQSDTIASVGRQNIKLSSGLGMPSASSTPSTSSTDSDFSPGSTFGRFKKGIARVPGKGDGTKDTVKAKLAPGEAVLNKAAADKMGRGLIGALNKMGAKKMGLV